MTVKAAAALVSLYWFGAMIGRFIGSAVLQKLPTRAVLGTVAVVACLLVVTSMLSMGWLAMGTIICGRALQLRDVPQHFLSGS